MENLLGAPFKEYFLYLMINDDLDEVFYFLSDELKSRGVSLLPIRFNQLSSFSALPDNSPVMLICSLRTQKDVEYFEKNLQKNLTLLLRQQKFTLIQLSSFEKTRLTQPPGQKKNSFFIKYPMSLPAVCAKMVEYHTYRFNEVHRWPGGKKAKPPTMVFN
jgi:hypothetical protein